MNRVLLATILCSAAVLGGCGTTIQPGMTGIKYIVLHAPALETDPRPEGFYFQWPWNSMVVYDVTWQTRSEAVDVLTADDLHVPTSVSVTFRPRATEIYRLHTEIGSTYYEDIIYPSFVTLIRSEFAKCNHNDLARGSPDIETAILGLLRKKLEGKPIDIDNVTIIHIKFDKAVTDSISEKLVMEQQSEQKAFEIEIAKQNAEIEREQARGQADAIRIRAKGEAQAIVIKGKAQGEAQAAIAETLTTPYLQYKAFEGSSSRYYFIPTGKDGLPLIINAESGPERRR